MLFSLTSHRGSPKAYCSHELNGFKGVYFTVSSLPISIYSDRTAMVFNVENFHTPKILEQVLMPVLTRTAGIQECSNFYLLDKHATDQLSTMVTKTVKNGTKTFRFAVRSSCVGIYFGVKSIRWRTPRVHLIPQ
jgi:hypothetical protein